MSKTDALLHKLVERINAAPNAPTAYGSMPVPARSSFDSVVRESHIRMIRSLARTYRQFGMQLIVDQATLGKSGVDELSDTELIALHRDLDRARECIRDDVSFEEAGILRNSFD
ncbi:hypothetical protein [Stenotrophomonas sp. VV52]|uniref:hypothetical protein n=1 Tax=Stenotrophomonas sp. VV52 TaxID=2066958 RepID=UPI00209C525D|nr:hypothetical protein [Stenotrophomonas sp. VV52]